MALNQLPKLLDPDFSSPLVTPNGISTIDNADQAAQYLTFAWHGQSGAPIDLISGKGPSSIVGPPLVGAGKLGKGTLFDGVNDQLTYADTGQIIATDEPFCIVIGSDLVGYSPDTFPGLMTCQRDGTSFIMGYTNNTPTYNDLFFGSNAGGNQFQCTIANSGLGVNQLVMYYNGNSASTSSNYRVWANGFEETVSTAGAFAGVTNVTSIGGNSNTGQDFNGLIHYAYVYRGIPEALAKTLVNTPHRSFKPAISPVYFTPSAGGANTLATDTGAYTQSGTAVSLEKASQLATDTASYSYSGTAVALNVGTVLPTDTTAYTYSGTALTFQKGSVIATDTAVYSYSGTAVSLEAALDLAADTAAYTYSGTAVELAVGQVLATDTDAYTYTGAAVSLDFAAAGAYTLNTDTAAYAYSGTAAEVAADLILVTDTTSYTLSGTAVALDTGYSLATDTDLYTLSGTNVTINVTSGLPTETGTYTYNGTSVTLTSSAQVWAIQADDSSIWTEQTDDSTTWNIQ